MESCAFRLPLNPVHSGLTGSQLVVPWAGSGRKPCWHPRVHLHPKNLVSRDGPTPDLLPTTRLTIPQAHSSFFSPWYLPTQCPPAQHAFPFSLGQGLMHSQRSNKNSVCVHTFKPSAYTPGTVLSILHMLTSLIFTTIFKK